MLASDGWSIAHLRELVVAHLVLGEDDGAVIERLNGMRESKPNSDDAERGAFGFHSEDRYLMAKHAQAAGRGGRFR